MKRNVSLNSLVIVVALLLILIVLVGETIRSRHSLALQTFDKGVPLPSFSLPELFNPEKSLTDNDLKGQVCLLNFWASWCSACHKEHSTLLMINKQFHVPIFGITFKDKAENTKQWLEKFGNPYGVVGIDNTGKVAFAFEVFGIPITYIIDKHGLVRYRYLGTLTNEVWGNDINPLVNKLNQEP